MVTFRNNNRRNNFRRNDRNFKNNVIDKNKFGANFSNNKSYSKPAKISLNEFEVSSVVFC